MTTITAIDCEAPPMTELLQEPHYSLAEVARMCGGVDPCTVWRWHSRGVGAHKVRLRTIRIGGKVRVLQRDLEAFLLAQNPGQVDALPPSRTPTQRRRAAERAAKELERLGV